MAYAEKIWGDCRSAVAYSMNFVQICYLSDSKGFSDFFTSSCDICESYDIQIKSLEYPKSRFSKKDYFYLDIGYYGISNKMYNDIINFGISKDNFKPIYSSNKDIVLGYQIIPQHVLSPVFDVNGMEEYVVCDKCRKSSYEYCDDTQNDIAYNKLGYPIYITKNAFENLEDLNGTFENQDIIISLELYNYLIDKYPKLECRPVFVGNIKQDKEYIRLHK